MALDPALVEALETAVAEAGQPASVAHRLNAWLKALSEGEASEDLQMQFYENTRGELQISGD